MADSSFDLEEFDFEDPSNSSQTDGQKILSMKDKDEMLQELKKENFDLKLRLYMTQKNSETAEGKVGEYEQQLAALLNSLEEQQKLSEEQARELEESKQRERELLGEKSRLEKHCNQQDEQIHNLSLSLSKMSTSMHDVTASPSHSTPARQGGRSRYDGDYSTEDHEDVILPITNQTNISHVSPMPREAFSTSSYQETSNLVENDRGVNHSYAEGSKYLVGGNSTTNNYYNSTPTMKQRNNRNADGGFDNVGIVRPNNTRTVVDVEYNDQIRDVDNPKKKKKGIMKMFKLCTGKSGDVMARNPDSMYVKREPARVTMTTYNE